MERRRDFRHNLRYPIQLRCERTSRVLDGLHTANVSASGLMFRLEEEGELAQGDRVKVELFARTELPRPNDALVLGARATVVRAESEGVALSFERPLAVDD